VSGKAQRAILAALVQPIATQPGTAGRAKGGVATFILPVIRRMNTIFKVVRSYMKHEPVNCRIKVPMPVPRTIQQAGLGDRLIANARRRGNKRVASTL
jgi:hypothetical protein